MDAWNWSLRERSKRPWKKASSTISRVRASPSNLNEDPFVYPVDRMAHQLLKNNGFAPDWIMEAKGTGSRSPSPAR